MTKRALVHQWSLEMGRPLARQPFPSDLTDDQWRQIAHLMPSQEAIGRPRQLDMREVVNAILYLLQTACGWRGLPARFPNRSSVRTYYDYWKEDGTWKSVCEVLEIPKGEQARRGKRSRRKDQP